MTGPDHFLDKSKEKRRVIKAQTRETSASLAESIGLGKVSQLLITKVHNRQACFRGGMAENPIPIFLWSILQLFQLFFHYICALGVFYYVIYSFLLIISLFFEWFKHVHKVTINLSIRLF